MTASDSSEPTETAERLNFIEQAITEDLARADHPQVHTRFPPEPNGYLHIGHAKAICVNFGLAERFGGVCNLRFDDTNPVKEDMEFEQSIQEDVRWLGFDWGDNLFYASSWFEDLYRLAEELIGKGLAYVCDLTQEETREHRGTATSPGKNSPYRERGVEENLDLFRRMRAGEFPDGAKTLKARIDMASPNFNLRDPVLYRILHAHHHRTGDAWCIYPMYDFAHGQCDALEHITHSICTLEFENHRPLYDWFIENLDLPASPRQIEFARFNPTFMVTSKRKLVELIEGGHVSGWDDPRMPTLRGLRRRGFTPSSVRKFAMGSGVTKFNAHVDQGRLEEAIREELNSSAERRMAVLDPLKVVITNWPEGKVEELEAINNPEDESAGTRPMELGREVWIERSDFREEAPRKFHRLKPGSEVRLRFAYVIRCDEVIKDEAGNVTELHCTYDPESGGGKTSDGRKVKGIVHWVADHAAVNAEVRIYDRLFSVPEPTSVEDGEDWKDTLNPDSLQVVQGAKLEPALGQAQPGERFQFERTGYFIADAVDSQPGAPVYNRIVGLRDSWAKIEKKG